MLIAHARVKTPLEFTTVLKSFKPDPRLIEQKLSLHLFSTELKSLVFEHIDSFLELYDALMLNDPSLCPHTWTKSSNPGGGIDQEPLVSLFLNSFPHDMGKSLHRLLQIKRRASFNEYIADFEAGLESQSEFADSVRALQVFFQKANAAKRGTSKTKDSRLDSLNAISSEPRAKTEMNEQEFETQLMALTSSHDKTALKGCFTNGPPRILPRPRQGYMQVGPQRHRTGQDGRLSGSTAGGQARLPKAAEVQEGWFQGQRSLR